ncbi:hypothetical protein BHE74_00040334, partial [Ensete ventricosum]
IPLDISYAGDRRNDMSVCDRLCVTLGGRRSSESKRRSRDLSPSPLTAPIPKPCPGR